MTDETTQPAEDPNTTPPVSQATDNESAPKPEVERDRKAPAQDATALQSNDHVTYNLDVDPNDPRNAAPTPQLPSLDDPTTQGPEHGRVGNDGDHSAEGQNGPNV